MLKSSEIMLWMAEISKKRHIIQPGRATYFAEAGTSKMNFKESVDICRQKKNVIENKDIYKGLLKNYWYRKTEKV